MSDEIPAVRYLATYTPENPPPADEVEWAQYFGGYLRVLGQHVVGREDRLLCDFNDLEEDGKTLTALLPQRTAHPAPGFVIGLVDSDGNTSVGTVVSSSHQIAMVEVNWDKWEPAPGFVDSLGDTDE